MPCSDDDDSQTGFSGDNIQGLSKAELRKTNKPIMEKKRRARINRCLNELKDLLTDADKDPARHSKLEKADILELTVKHLQTLQRQQLAAAIAADPAVLQRFKAGFGDCAVEVRRYLSRLASVPTGLRHRLGNHLTSCISGIERLHPPPVDYLPLVSDPLRLEDDRPSAFHFVKSLKPNSPPLSPLSCDSACDSSTELETPPRPIQKFPFPTPPSRSASDQDSSPETQKATVSSTTISPETMKQESSKAKQYMEPLSIVIDVENYKIGIDASPKRAVDYSMRHKLKRPFVDLSGPAPKIIRFEPEKRSIVLERKVLTTESTSAFKRVQERTPTFLERRLTVPDSIPAVIARPIERFIPVATQPQPQPPPPSIPPLQLPSVISHTAESLAQSTSKRVHTSQDARPEADTNSRSPEPGTSNTEMWRPW